MVDGPQPVNRGLRVVMSGVEAATLVTSIWTPFLIRTTSLPSSRSPSSGSGAA